MRVLFHTSYWFIWERVTFGQVEPQSTRSAHCAYCGRSLVIPISVNLYQVYITLAVCLDCDQEARPRRKPVPFSPDHRHRWPNRWSIQICREPTRAGPRTIALLPWYFIRSLGSFSGTLLGDCVFDLKRKFATGGLIPPRALVTSRPGRWRGARGDPGGRETARTSSQNCSETYDTRCVVP